MSRRLSRWDALGLVALLGFGAAWAGLEAGRDAPGPPPAEQLLDPSTDIQLGEEWMGLYFKGDRVGLIHVEKTARDGGYRYAMHTTLRLKALGSDAPLDLRIGADLDDALALERFDFEVDAGPAQLGGAGEVRGTTIEMTLETGGETVERTIELDAPPALRSNLGPLLSRGGLEPGRTARFHTFDPLTQRHQPVDVEVIGPDTIVILDREVQATRIRTTAAGMALDGWINHRGEMLRQEMGLGLVAVRETRQQARFALMPGARAGADLIVATRVAAPDVPRDLKRRSSLALRLGGVDLSTFTLDDRRQRFDRETGTLRITREPVGAGLPLPVSGGQHTADDLASDGLIQSDHPRVRDRARSIVGEAGDTLGAARALMAWIADNIEQEAVGGVPSALDVLESRVGDCNEHSALFAALARSVGVPTRIVVGLVFVDGHFGYHAWNEVLTADGWLSLDATWGQLPVDVGHVALLRGGLAEHGRLLPLMGELTIEAAR